MKQTDRTASRDVAHLIPREHPGPDADTVSPFAIAGNDHETGDLICAGLEELSRHLKWLDDDYRTGKFDRVEARARSIVLLADQLGMRHVGQVAADVVYCVDGPDEIALAATLSRLMRLVAQALDHAAGPMPAF